MTVSFTSNKWQIKRKKERKKHEEASHKDLRERRQKLEEKREPNTISALFMSCSREIMMVRRSVCRNIFTLLMRTCPTAIFLNERRFIFLTRRQSPLHTAYSKERVVPLLEVKKIIHILCITDLCE